MPAATSAATAAWTRGTVPMSHTGVPVAALLSLRSGERLMQIKILLRFPALGMVYAVDVLIPFTQLFFLSN